ncbi:hypothetical protein EZJ58_4422 [Sodalis ligni]|uniref:Uncharacterized protein n=1 Tax=Sodalis ligni TaxID=2697027 RepID=A0A4R1NGN5_9GAMM|nr:hypothetical protein EZJ58_4422 [Sodalis ligni]
MIPWDESLNDYLHVLTNKLDQADSMQLTNFF